MYKKLFLKGLALSIAFGMHASVWAQHCPNLDFSYGTFYNWQPYLGLWGPMNVPNPPHYFIAPSGAVPGRLDIMSRNALEKSGLLYDELCSKIPKVPDGFNFSCKIGNNAVGGEVDGIEYEMTVNNSNSLLLVHFAWVMGNDPSHTSAEQPQFSMTIKNSAGNVITSLPCNGFYLSNSLIIR